MSACTIPCPLCNAALHSAGPVPRGRMLRCPRCGGHFNADERPAEPLAPLPSHATVSPAFKMGLIAFGLVGLVALVIGGGIGLAMHSTREASRQAAIAAADRHAAEEQRAALQNLLAQQREEFEREQRERERAFERERKVKAAEEKPPPPAPVVPTAALTPPAPAPSPPADDGEAKKRADYEARIDAGRAAMVGQRYADALREYQAAVRLMPGDAVATRGVRDAEDRLDAQQEQVKNRTTVTGLVDKAKNSLRAKHYDDALSAANEALRLVPGDPDARQVQRDVTQARRTAKADFAQLVSQADQSRDAGRFEEASRLYARALDIFPDDDAARGAKRAVDQAAGDAQAGLAAYYRFMTAGMLSMQNGQYVDAARAFGEASRLVPTDIAAARGYRDAVAGVNGVVVGQGRFYRHLQAGYTALQARNPADAINAFQAALRLVPDSPLAAAGLQQAKAMKK